jgi:hypothetical protein
MYYSFILIKLASKAYSDVTLNESGSRYHDSIISVYCNRKASNALMHTMHSTGVSIYLKRKVSNAAV